MESTLLLTTPLELVIRPELEAGTLVALEEPASEVDGAAADEDDPATEVPALVADDDAPVEEAADDPDVAPADDANDDDTTALEAALLELEPPAPEEDAPDAEVPAPEEADAAALEPARDDDDATPEVPDTALLAPVLLAGPPALEPEESATTHWPVSGSQVSPASHGTPGHNRPQVPLPWHTRPCAQSSCAVHV